MCSSAVAYSHISTHLEHSTVNIPGAWYVWLRFSNGRMHEELANNRFELLFMYIDMALLAMRPCYCKMA